MSAPPVDLRSVRPAEHHLELMAGGVVPYQRCDACGRPGFAPRVLCPLCGCTQLSWHESSGAGVVYSATTVHSRDAAPYTVVLVDLDEGIRVMATLTGCVPDDDGSAIGTRVDVSVGELTGRPALLAAPAGDGP